MIDRLVHHAEVLTLTGDSYRTPHPSRTSRQEPHRQQLTSPASPAESRAENDRGDVILRASTDGTGYQVVSGPLDLSAGQ
jgi:hypothetical protein